MELHQESFLKLITHLAFYSGWPNAMSALAVAKDIFANHGDFTSGTTFNRPIDA